MMKKAIRSLAVCGSIALLLVASACEEYFVDPPAAGSARLALSLAWPTALSERGLVRITKGTTVVVEQSFVVSGPETRVAVTIPDADEAAEYTVEVQIRGPDDALLYRGTTRTQIKRSHTTTATLTVDPTPRRVAALATGMAHTCVLDEIGEAYCWGANQQGQLGDGSTTSRTTPTKVAGGHTFTQIAAGGYATCGLTAEGSVHCWGGLNSSPTTVAPTLLFAGSTRLVTLALSTLFQAAGGTLRGGGMTLCGLDAGGAAHCFGSGRFGTLGRGDTLSSPALAPVLTAERFQALSAGLGHVCGLNRAGRAICWGSNAFGQIGADTTRADALLPKPVAGDLIFTTLSAGATTTCGTTPASSYCWGTNYFGSLGQGFTSTATPRVPLPAAVTTSTAFSRVVTGSENNIFTPSCALTSSGDAYCWGANNFGQLGTAAPVPVCTGSTTPCATVPIAVSGGLKFEVIDTGGDHVCGITTDGKLWCWGRNDAGQLGNGTTTQSNTPVAVTVPFVVPK